MLIGFWWVLFLGCMRTTDPIDSENTSKPIQVWTTTGSKTNTLSNSNISYDSLNNNLAIITLDTTDVYQQMDGFGYTLTGGSAYLINRMENSTKEKLLNDLFSCTDGICISYLRLSLGASDLSSEVFSYCDLPYGSEDLELKSFSLSKDTTDLIPILKQILKINPNIKLMASPWSAPVWMKSSNSSIGGKLQTKYYEVYSRYFVRYLQEMEKQGIHIEAVTVQNEPQHGGNNPSMLMSWTEQADFVKNYLGPAFQKADLKTKIIIWDHNCDNYQYPINILNDAQAKPYIDGSAFHLYGGEVGALSLVHTAHPDKNIYFTEQWTGANGTFDGDLKWHIRNVLIGTSRNWSKTILEWNLASDPSNQPHTSGGCTLCQGAVTINGNLYSKNVSYYIIAHASKFVPTASKRVHSTYFESLPNVAFLTPQGKKVLIVLNESESNKMINVRQGNKIFKVDLKAVSVNTIIW